MIYRFHRVISGPLQNRIDSWSLFVSEATGNQSVEHSWNYLLPDMTASLGKLSWSMDAFRAGDAPQQAKDALEVHLASRSRLKKQKPR